jgi:hypothetical protein
METASRVKGVETHTYPLVTVGKNAGVEKGPNLVVAGQNRRSGHCYFITHFLFKLLLLLNSNYI